MPSVKITATCSHCKQEFTRGKYDIERTLKKSGLVYCCIKCAKADAVEKQLIEGFTATKVCTKCNVEKERSNTYFPSNPRTLDKLDSWCKSCRASYRSHLRRGNYKSMIADDDLIELLKLKECIICGSEEKLVVDHCHKTNTVRGMLCNRCNMGLGQFRDDPYLLEFARIYLLSVSNNPEEVNEFNLYLSKHSHKPVRKWNC